MKKLIITALFVAATGIAFAQKEVKTTSKGVPLYTLAPIAINTPWSYNFSSQGNVILRAVTHQNSRMSVDSLTLYVKKSQIRWVNDSVAIVKP